MSSGALLEIADLTVQFGLRGRRQVLRAVDGVSFDLFAGETVAIVGESGSGKSTLARAIVRLVDIAGGSIVVDGVNIATLKRGALREFRQRTQMVFQDPYSSLDPSMTIGDSIAEPLRVHTSLTSTERVRTVHTLLQRVGLRAEHAARYPREFSGGQRQRIAIARAISVNPSVLVADEPISALDVSSQNQILLLLKELAAELGIGCIFISHDLGAVRHIADRVLVMYFGRIVESAQTDRLFSDPQHPYTQALLSAVLSTDLDRQRSKRRIRLEGEAPDASGPGGGCAFSARCRHAIAMCHASEPVAVPQASGGYVACHLAGQLSL